MRGLQIAAVMNCWKHSIYLTEAVSKIIILPVSAIPIHSQVVITSMSGITLKSNLQSDVKCAGYAEEVLR